MASPPFFFSKLALASGICAVAEIHQPGGKWPDFMPCGRGIILRNQLTFNRLHGRHGLAV